MKKVFIVKGWTPYDLLSISKDEFYNVANQEYYTQFNTYIDIKHMDLTFVKNNIKVKIIEFSKDN